MAEALTVAALPAPHAFFTRRGGVSTGPFASLNCSLSSQDDRNAVMENRARVARKLAVEPMHLAGLMQVHGAAVVTVDRPWTVGQGPRADAMVTARRGIALGIITADCAPVLFADPEANIVGAAHAGWRGALAGVLESTLAAMHDLGASPERIVAAIGPCIAQQSYEVGIDLRDAILTRRSQDNRFFAEGQRPDHWQFDLTGYCESRLAAAGVRHVASTSLDTLADEERFFSHRRRMLINAGPIGHQISVIRPA